MLCRTALVAIVAFHYLRLDSQLLSKKRNYNGKRQPMSEIFSTALLAPVLVLVGLSVGFLLLKLQGGEE
jgi:cytochrome b6-f complex subunit 7